MYGGRAVVEVEEGEGDEDVGYGEGVGDKVEDEIVRISWRWSKYYHDRD